MKKLSAILLSALILTQSAYASEIVQNPIENNGYEISDIYDENRFVVYEKNSDGKYEYGVIDANGNIIVPVEHDFIIINGAFFWAIADNKINEKFFDYNGNEIENNGNLNYFKKSEDGIFWDGYVTGGSMSLYSYKTGEMVILDDDIELLGRVTKTLIRAKHNNKYGVLNFAGEIIVPFIYEDINSIAELSMDTDKEHENELAVQKNNKWGIIDINQNIVVPFSFDEIVDYDEDTLITKKNNQYAVFNVDGTQILPYTDNHISLSSDLYEYVAGIGKPYIILHKQDNFDTKSVYDLSGKEIISNDNYAFIYARNTDKYFVVAYYDEALGDGTEKYGVVDNTGEIIIPLEYDKIDYIDIQNQHIYVEKDGKSLALSMDNEISFEFEFDYNRVIGDIIITKQEIPEQYKIYNKNFEELNLGTISSIYDYTEYGIDAILIVADNKAGYIDTQGNITIDFIYDNLSAYNAFTNYSQATKNFKSGIVDMSGNIVLPLEYDKILFAQNNDDVLLAKDGAYNVISNLSLYIDTPAKYSYDNILINGSNTELQAYKIEDNNYFKLRDVAQVLSDTQSQFNIVWNEEEKSIDLLSNTAYTSVGGELEVSDKSDKIANLANPCIMKNGEIVRLTAYNIADNNYFKLRDLAYIIGFTVKYDEATGTVEIITE